MALARVAKVLCYVVRDGHLLVFRHRDYPEAGLQVPAGTLHEGEDPAVGALRETDEETGRSGFRIVRALGRYDHEFRDTFAGVERHEIHVRHVFLVEPPAGLPERWSHLAEEGNGDFWFEFWWTPINEELRLAGDQHSYLGAAAVPLSSDLTSSRGVPVVGDRRGSKSGEGRHPGPSSGGSPRR